MNKQKFLVVLFCILLPLFLLLFSYKVVFSLSDHTPEQQAWLDYFNGEQLPEGYTELEVSHMNDVQGVMKFADVAFYVLLLALSLVMIYYKKKKKILRKLLNYGGKTTVISLIVLLFLSLTAFNWLFALFHQIFFPQGNWQFGADSLLIQTWPIEFFMTISSVIFIFSLILGMFFILVSKYMYHDH